MPSLDEKLEILHLMEQLHIDVADIGMPGAGPRAMADAERLLREIGTQRMRLRPMVACRTLIDPDLRGAADLAQRTGEKLTVYAFIGSSPIRLWAEDWSLDSITKKTEESIAFAVREGLEVIFVTEDTTRTPPRTLRSLFGIAIGAGARGICICDTAGHLTIRGLWSFHRFLAGVLAEMGALSVTLDWHGHNDRGLALPLSLAALEMGFDRAHGCALGIGERVGNAALDLIIMNLKLDQERVWPHDVSMLVDYVQAVSRATGVPVPTNYPLSGRDAFRTASGIHAAAIVKATRKGDRYLADRVYSGVPAAEFGRVQEIEISSMSGVSNVSFWLERREIEPEASLVSFILSYAKKSDRVLDEEDVKRLVRDWQGLETACHAATVAAPSPVAGNSPPASR
jgi:2-isopropylmalate synthase